MNNLIDRQDAKNKKVYSEERHEYVIPVAEIDRLPSAQCWIPCSERLPESGLSVLISYDGTVFKDFLIKYNNGAFLFHHSDLDEKERQNIAWMPLPEPWKGGEDDKG